MISKIKELNSSIPGMLFIDAVYLLIGEVIILAFVPDKLSCAIGFAAGILYSVFCTFHMSLRIRKVVYGGAKTSVTLVIGYLIRLIVMFAVFAILYFTDTGNLLCAVIGMFSMKVAAYLQPVADKLFNLLKKGR